MADYLLFDELEIGLTFPDKPVEYKVTAPTVDKYLAATGDTSPEGLDNNPEFYETKILITEMTFVSPEHRPELIHKNGHMHLDDFVERQAKFNNEIVIAGHFSTRYNRHQAEKIVSKQLPDMLGGRLKLWV